MPSELTAPIIIKVVLNRGDLREAAVVSRKIELPRKATVQREWLALIVLLFGIMVGTYWVAGPDRVVQTMVVEVFVVAAVMMVKGSKDHNREFLGEWEYEFVETGFTHKRKSHGGDLLMKLPWGSVAGYTETLRQLVLWSPEGGAFIFPRSAFRNPDDYAQLKELFSRRVKQFKLNRRFWQFHLATGIVMMFAAGAMIWINAVETQSVLELQWGFPLPLVQKFNGTVRGSPEFVEKVMRPRVLAVGLIVDVTLAVLVILGVAVMSELFIRNRKTQR